MARRRREGEVSDAGQDSFLDIVANIVGILIILVMVVAVRAKNAPVTLSVPSPEQQAAEKELARGREQEAKVHRAVLETAAKIRELQAARRAQASRRNQLALMTAAAQEMIAKRRDELDAEGKAAFDRRSQLADARAELDRLEGEYELTSRVRPETVRVESYPTPLSRAVMGHELHLQLRGGRIMVLPWDDILEELKATFRRQIGRMGPNSHFSGKLGPIGGFRVSYTIRRHDPSMRQYEATGAGQTVFRLEEFFLLPVSTEMGEPVDAALAPGSELHEALARCRPGRTTVTIWCYPNSFDEYRRLRKMLYELGYATAGRPMPEGELIGGSARGSRSAAQ